MGGDLPSVTPRLAHRRASASVWHVCRMLDDAGSCFYCALTDTIGVLHVDIKERWQEFARASPVTDHDHRVADPYESRSSRGHFGVRVEYDLRKPTTAATSGVNIRGMTDGQPFGCKRLTFEAP